MTRRLDSVCMEDGPMVMRDGGKFAHGLDRADLIVRHHDADDAGLPARREARRQHGLEVIRRDAPRAIDRQVRDGKALLFEPFARPQHGRVLDGGCHDAAGHAFLAPRERHAFERRIVALAAVTREKDVGGRCA